jgi:hypothetical protein
LHQSSIRLGNRNDHAPRPNRRLRRRPACPGRISVAQIVDLVAVSSNAPEDRAQVVESCIGLIDERWLVLPDPTNGRRASAPVDNDWPQPAPARRRQKIEALHN